MAARPLFNHPPGRSCCRATCYVPHGVSKWMDAIHTGSQVVISCEQCTTHTTLHTHTTPVATAVRTAAPRGRAMRRTSPARSAVRSSAPRRRRGRPRPPPARPNGRGGAGARARGRGRAAAAAPAPAREEKAGQGGSSEGEALVPMLECGGCLRGYHLDCLDPPLPAVPKVHRRRGRRAAGATE